MSTARGKVLFATAGSIIFLAWKPFADLVPKLLWNASASVPVGLYWIENRPPMRGEIAVLKLPEWVALIASERQYLPRKVWLLKPVAASNADVVCRFGAHVFVNGKHVAKALLVDKNHRQMPTWRVCKILNAEQVFVLSRHRDSFDSRYFGPVDRAFVAGTAKPIMLFEP
jgi:conjugative transfer signal peptidase TraF